MKHFGAHAQGGAVALSPDIVVSDGTNCIRETLLWSNFTAEAPLASSPVLFFPDTATKW